MPSEQINFLSADGVDRACCNFAALVHRCYSTAVNFPKSCHFRICRNFSRILRRLTGDGPLLNIFANSRLLICIYLTRFHLSRRSCSILVRRQMFLDLCYLSDRDRLVQKQMSYVKAIFRIFHSLNMQTFFVIGFFYPHRKSLKILLSNMLWPWFLNLYLISWNGTRSNV